MMMLHHTQTNCREHGENCPYLNKNQPSEIKHSTPYTKMYELCNHDCAIVELFARIGLLRRTMNPVLYKIPLNHPVTNPAFYQEFKSTIISNFKFYLNTSPRILISILSTIADHDPRDCDIATAALIFCRIEEIKNTCLLSPNTTKWEASPEEYKRISRSPEWQALGTGHVNNNTIINTFIRINRTIQKSSLVHHITLKLYDHMFDPESGYPYSPLVAKPGMRIYPNWVQMIVDQSNKQKLIKRFRKLLANQLG